MEEAFCILTKSEFISLLNNLELLNTSYLRFFTFEDIKSGNAESIFYKLPQLEYDEDYLIIKCSIYKEDNFILENYRKIKINDLLELIPVTSTSLLSYQRKFSQILKWTDPSKYNFEELYNCYVESKMRYESTKNFELCQRFLLNIDSNSFITEDLLKKVIQAKIDKKLKGKKAIEIKHNEYKHVFQSLMVYEQGSHLPRETAFGFLLHAIGVIILNQGLGIDLKLLINLKKTKFIKNLNEINEKKNLNNFDSIFSDDEIVALIATYNSKFSDKEFKDNYQNLIIVTYYLFYKFLIDDKKVSLQKIINTIKEIKGERNISEEEKAAILLISIYSSTSSIAEDIMLSYADLSIINSQNNTYIIDFEFIKKYYLSNQSSDIKLLEANKNEASKKKTTNSNLKAIKK